MKLLKPGDSFRLENQKTAINYLKDITGAISEPVNQNFIVRIGNGDKRRKNHGLFYVYVLNENEKAPAKITEQNNEYGQQFLKLFCTGIKIIRQFKDGRIAIYTINKSTWLKMSEFKMIRNLHNIDWQELKKMCCEKPMVSRPG